jgi:hypothetical protein
MSSRGAAVSRLALGRSPLQDRPRAYRLRSGHFTEHLRGAVTMFNDEHPVLRLHHDAAPFQTFVVGALAGLVCVRRQMGVDVRNDYENM